MQAAAHPPIDQWQDLPAFLLMLEQQGFVLHPDTWTKIFQIALNTSDATVLTARIGSLVTKNPEGRYHFDQIAQYYFTGVFSTSEEPEQPKEKVTEFRRHWERSKRWYWKNSRIISSLILLGIMFYVMISEFEMMVKFYQEILPKPDFWTLGTQEYLLIVSLLIALTSYYFYRRRRLVMQRVLMDAPLLFWDFKLPKFQLISFGSDFLHLPKKLVARQASELQELDLKATIAKSVRNNGWFSPVFSYRSSPVSYLFLIDFTHESNHQAQLAELVADWLHHKQVPVVRFKFRNTPEICWNNEFPEGIGLETLTARYVNYRLVIFGDAWRFINGIENRLADWTRSFDFWVDKALLTPIPENNWGKKEQLLKGVFAVLPATGSGFSQLADEYIDTDKSWKRKVIHPKRYPGLIIRTDQLEADLNQHFSPTLQKWLCALAFFPKLNWNLTLFLGKSLDERLLTFDNISRITQLSWFYNGFIPNEIREKLYNLLNKTEAQKTHLSILSFLEQQKSDKESHFSMSLNELDVQIAVHRLGAGLPMQADLWHKLKYRAHLGGQSDFLVLKYARKISPIDIIYPAWLNFVNRVQGYSLTQKFEDYLRRFATSYLITSISISLIRLVRLRYIIQNLFSRTFNSSELITRVTIFEKRLSYLLRNILTWFILNSRLVAKTLAYTAVIIVDWMFIYEKDFKLSIVIFSIGIVLVEGISNLFTKTEFDLRRPYPYRREPSFLSKIKFPLALLLTAFTYYIFNMSVSSVIFLLIALLIIFAIISSSSPLDEYSEGDYYPHRYDGGYGSRYNPYPPLYSPDREHYWDIRTNRWVMRNENSTGFWVIFIIILLSILIYLSFNDN